MTEETFWTFIPMIIRCYGPRVSRALRQLLWNFVGCPTPLPSDCLRLASGIPNAGFGLALFFLEGALSLSQIHVFNLLPGPSPSLRILDRSRGRTGSMPRRSKKWTQAISTDRRTVSDFSAYGYLHAYLVSSASNPPIDDI